MSSIPWLVGGLLAFVWYLALGWQTLGWTLGRMSRHWFPMALYGMVCLMASGHIGTDLGIPMLFRDDPVLGFNRNSPAFWCAFGAAVLLGQIWISVYLLEYIANYAYLDPGPRQPGWDRPRRWADLSQAEARFDDPRSMLQLLLASMPPFLVLLALCGAFPAQDSVMGSPVSVWRELLVYTSGMLLGVAALVVLVLAGFGLARLARRSAWVRRAATVSSRGLRIDDGVPAGQSPDPRSTITVAFWVFLVVLLLAEVVPLSVRMIVPSWAICVLIGLILAVYFVLVALKRRAQLVFLVVFVTYIGWSNSAAYKFRLPGMRTNDDVSLYEPAELLPAESVEANSPGPDDPLLDNLFVLRHWKEQLNDKRPKLVIVSVTGGAYRAGFWAAAVLDELERRSGQGGTLPGLTDRIRIMTGASGGTVGAAYFVALRDRRNVTVVDAMLADSGRDSLTPVIQQMVQRDIPMILWPTNYQTVDRGMKLEQQWKTIARPVHATYADEKKGRRPSLIITPMVIETGQRMLISNLDLEDITSPVSTTGETYLASARQFYRLFPSAQPTFGLNTAVRMSASFPYVSPAVSLPMKPIRRVVDAGYYDNYGVNLAAAWCYQYRDWILRETSGIALIQIHAFPRNDGSEPTPVKTTTGRTFGESMAQSMSWLTSPVEGALGARNWSMLYRNEEQLRMLDDTFNKPDAGSRMFETFVFENPGGAAMNWIIALDDVLDMQKSIAGGLARSKTEKTNNEQMDKLTAWWNAMPYIRRPQRAISAPDQLQQTQFDDLDAIAPDDAQRVTLTLNRFQTYVNRLGYTPKPGSITIRKLKQLNGYHEFGTNVMKIGSKLMRDRDTVLHEYTHYVFSNLETSDWDTLGGLAEGLADYFACSFKGEPEVGANFVEEMAKQDPSVSYPKPYLRTLDNHRRFDQISKSPDDKPEVHDEGEVWGGAFWELRAIMGRDAKHNHRADVLLLRSGLNIKLPPPRKGAREAFLSQLLEQDKALYEGSDDANIRKVFERRGLKPLPSPSTPSVSK